MDQKRKMSTSDTETAEIKLKSVKADFKHWKVAEYLLRIVKFWKEDPHLLETIKFLWHAMKISEWENALVVYNLALMYRAKGKLQLMKEGLEKALHREKCLRDPDTICLGWYQQTWQRNAQVKKGEAPVEDQSIHAADGPKNNLKMLLVDSWNPTPRWHHLEFISHSRLLTRKNAVKLWDKGTLFQLICNKKSLAINICTEQIHPHKAKDQEHLKLCIENYVELHQYEEAIALTDMLQWISQREQTMELYEDQCYLPKVYTWAAKESLLITYKSHFMAVFQRMADDDWFSTSSVDMDTVEQRTPIPPTWDTHIGFYPYLTRKSSESSTVGPREPRLDLGSRPGRFGEL